jgi:hypothetical protein
VTRICLIWRTEIRVPSALGRLPRRARILNLAAGGRSGHGWLLPGARVPLVAHTNQLDTVSASLTKLPRLPLWENVRRLAIGLRVLHTDGLIHRNLDAAAVFSGTVRKQQQQVHSEPCQRKSAPLPAVLASQCTQTSGMSAGKRGIAFAKGLEASNLSRGNRSARCA